MNRAALVDVDGTLIDNNLQRSRQAKPDPEPSRSGAFGCFCELTLLAFFAKWYTQFGRCQQCLNLWSRPNVHGGTTIHDDAAAFADIARRHLIDHVHRGRSRLIGIE